MLSVLLAAAFSIPFSVTNDTAFQRQGALVNAGLPLPAGAARDVKQLRIVGYDQLSEPVQLSPLARWPDGSLRWVQARFLTDLDAAEKKEWTLTNGNSTALSRWVARVQIEDGQAVLSSGVMQYRAGELLGPLTVQPVEGKPFVAAPPDNVVLDQPGPILISCRREGWLTRGQEHFCRYSERYAVVAGQPAVRVTLRLSAPAEPAAGPVKMIGFDVQPGFGSVRSLTIGTASGANTLPLGTTRRLEQPRVAAHPISDRQHPGWLDWRADGGALLFATRWFWQLAPKALDVNSNGTVRCELYSAAAPPLAWPPGRTITHQFILWFHHAGDSFDYPLVELNQPLLAAVTPDAMAATHALGKPTTTDRATQPTAPQPEPVGLLEFGDPGASDRAYAEAMLFAQTGQRSHWQAMVEAARYELSAGVRHPDGVAAYYWFTGDPDAAAAAAAWQPSSPPAPRATGPGPAPGR